MPTVDRVLPWRRNSAPSSVELAPLLATFRDTHPRASTGLITKAYERAKAAHRNQVRKSGEAYIHHPLEVANVVAGMALDDEAVAAALLHDAVEDTGVTLEDVIVEFGPNVAELVNGVTKLERVEFASREEQQAASVRKMLVAMADDMRVLLIKLADRLHNMRTIAGLSPAKQHRIAQETLDIYAPLAHRLGMQDIRNQLEDLSFATLYPARYAELDHMVAVRSPERDLYLYQVLEEVRQRLGELGIEAEVSGRPKHLWSIYEKMVIKGRAFEEIHDLVGIRVVVASVKDCWAALGCIHATWAPVQGRFKDYVSMPKFNLYQSLHTTVIGPQGKPLEVQLRTREMHLRAEHGVAAHWAYKDRGKPGPAKARNGELPWVDRIMDRDADGSDPKAFMAALKSDLVIDEIYVFTPKGKVIDLARDATPIDFAYAVHTEVGHACQGARVNGRMVPLRHRLQSGDTVEILTHAGGRPSRDWLTIAVTPRATNKIRQWFSRERREDALANGKEALQRELRRQNLPTQKLPSSVVLEAANALNFADVDALHTAIGENHVSAESVVHRISRLLAAGSPDRVDQLPAEMRSLVSGGRARQGRDRAGATNGAAGVHVEGLDDVLVRLSLCCKPLPGDEIIGFVTKGRGVSVHRADCANADSLTVHDDRLIDVEWNEAHQGDFTAAIQVEALDRPSLLMEVSKALADQQVNIVRASMAAGEDRVATMHFEFELGDAAQLHSILNTLKRVDGVYSASRRTEGTPVTAGAGVGSGRRA